MENYISPELSLLLNYLRSKNNQNSIENIPFIGIENIKIHIHLH